MSNQLGANKIQASLNAQDPEMRDRRESYLSSAEIQLIEQMGAQSQTGMSLGYSSDSSIGHQLQ